MEKKILVIVAVLTGVVAIVWFVISSYQRSSSVTSTLTPTPALQLKPGEHIDHQGPPDVRTDRLPDGSKIEYGTLGGPLTPLMEEEMKKIIQEKKRKQIEKQSHIEKKDFSMVSASYTSTISDLFFSFPRVKPLFAADPVQSLVIELGSAQPSHEQTIRNYLRNNILYWAIQDLQKLVKVKFVTKAEISGSFGQWTYIKQWNPDGTFADLEGVMWIAHDGPVETTFIHEYGHHFTNYWAAMRTNGLWDNDHVWPPDSAGDYYALRPMKPGCSCSSFDDAVCPYSNRIWEIIAEDYRMTASAYNAGHIFADAGCLSGGGKVDPPNLQGVSNYFANLPLSGPLTVIVIDPTAPTITPVPQMCLGVQHCTTPFSIDQTYCGDCTGPNCIPGNQCKENTAVCTTYRDKVFPTDEFYALPCDKLPKLSAKSGVAGPVPTYFPRQPFSSCYARGGVCTHKPTCDRFSGTTFEFDATICPSAEGCCLFPNPVPIAPTLTPCEHQGGICTKFVPTCTSQGGTIDTSKGCAAGNQCCTFPSANGAYTNREYQNLARKLQEGTIGSLEVSAWIDNACRTPRLQAQGCDPNIEGDCERLACVK